MKADFVNFAKMTLISGITSCFSCCISTAYAADGSDAQASNVISSASSDESLIRKTTDDFAKAYAAGDASTIANMCADECCFTDTNGMTFNGRDSIKKMYEQNFASSGLQPLSLKITKITFPTSDVAIEDGQASSAKAYSTSTYSVVHVKKDGVWKMLRINEYENSLAASEVLKSLDWMIGDWTLHGANKNVYLKVYPINHGSFLAMRFSDSDNENDNSASAQMQIIGWNAKSKSIVSWNFGHEGGTGYGHWLQDGDNWLITTRGTTHDGADSTAVYIIKHPDSSHFNWESVGRSINGVKLPNTGTVEATKRQAVSK